MRSHDRADVGGGGGSVFKTKDTIFAILNSAKKKLWTYERYIKENFKIMCTMYFYKKRNQPLKAVLDRAEVCELDEITICFMNYQKKCEKRQWFI